MSPSILESTKSEINQTPKTQKGLKMKNQNNQDDDGLMEGLGFSKEIDDQTKQDLQKILDWLYEIGGRGYMTWSGIVLMKTGNAEVHFTPRESNRKGTYALVPDDKRIKTCPLVSTERTETAVEWLDKRRFLPFRPRGEK